MKKERKYFNKYFYEKLQLKFNHDTFICRLEEKK